MAKIIVHGTYDSDLMPSYGSLYSSGADLRADISEAVELPPGERITVPTGVYLQIPEGYEGQVRPRSGLADKFGITVLNSPGTIDSDYRGEIRIILYNSSKEPYTVEPKTRIAQLVFSQVVQAEFIITNELEESNRGEGGFGSTGI
jgi:dUTP pyrophosphatase